MYVYLEIHDWLSKKPVVNHELADILCISIFLRVRKEKGYFNSRMMLVDFISLPHHEQTPITHVYLLLY